MLTLFSPLKTQMPNTILTKQQCNLVFGNTLQAKLLSLNPHFLSRRKKIGLISNSRILIARYNIQLEKNLPFIFFTINESTSLNTPPFLLIIVNYLFTFLIEH